MFQVLEQRLTNLSFQLHGEIMVMVTMMIMIMWLPQAHMQGNRKKQKTNKCQFVSSSLML